MTHDELRSVVLECLRKPRQHFDHSPPFSVPVLFGEVAILAQSRGLKTVGDGHDAWLEGGGRYELHPNLRGPIWSLVWDLIIEGILRRGRPSGDTAELPLIYVTDYGKNALGTHPSPYDPEGYLKGMCEKVPNLDPIILEYLTESIGTLRGNHLLASTVTMGTASEQAMLNLFEATLDACDAPKKTTLENALKKNRQIKPQSEEYRKWFDGNLKARLKTDKGNEWLSEIEEVLLFLFNHFRRMRNDAGHPTGTKIIREEAVHNLRMFPRYLQRIYELIDWLDANKPI